MTGDRRRRRSIAARAALACAAAPATAGLLGSVSSAGAVAMAPDTIASGALSRGSGHGSPSFPKVPSGSKVTIDLASYLPAISSGAASTLDSLVRSFESAHRNITVDVESLSFATSIPVQVQQDIVAGTAPDVLQDSFNDIRFVASSLGAADLTKVVGSSSLAAEFGGQYRYAPAVAKLGMVGGDAYGVPWTLSTPVLFYNASLFRKAGLSPADPPKTWSQLASDAAQIKSETGASGLANGCVGAFGGGSDWCLQAIIDSDGGSVMNAAQTKVTFTSPGLVRAISQMRQLAQSGAMVNLSTPQAIGAWASGQLAMVLNSSALQSTLIGADGGHFQMLGARLPAFGTKPSVPTNSGSALFMLSRQRLKREADWELMQWLTSPSSETSITENIGYPPLRPSIAGSSQYLATWATSNPYLAVNLGQLEHVHAWLAYPGPNYQAITTTLVNAVNDVVFQSTDPASTMATAQSTAARLLGAG